MKRTIIATSLFFAVIVFLSAYALGVLDNSGVTRVNSSYESGGFTYSGGLSKGLFSGYGEIEFENGDSYHGGFTDGRFDGEGVFAVPEEGWRFEGVYSGGQPGSGTFFLSDAHTVTFGYPNNLTGQDWAYEGAFDDQGQQGVGTFTFADGSAYTGEFYHGLAEGQGTYTDASGSIVYVGEFYEGMFDGYGIYYSPEGWIYEGEFYEGLFDGEGSITIDGTVIYGFWEWGVQTVYGEN